MVFITNQMPLLTTLVFAREKKEVWQMALPFALCMERGRMIKLFARLDGGLRMILQSNDHSRPPCQFEHVHDWTS